MSLSLSIVVVPVCGRADDAVADASSTHVELTVIVPPPRGTVPRRRVAGLHGVTTDLVAFVEDTTRLCPGWGASMAAAFAADPAVVAAGGPIRVAAGLTPRERGLVLFDFGPFLDPGYAGSDIPGNAMCFRTAPLREALHGADGLRRMELLPTFTAAGGRTAFVREAVATWVGPDPNGVSAVSQLRHARAFAGRARADGRTTASAARVLGWPAVAALRAVRAARAWDHTVGPGALGHAARLSLAWGLGEALGAALGPGDAEEAWR